jgi:hypothetical protein
MEKRTDRFNCQLKTMTGLHYGLDLYWFVKYFIVTPGFTLKNQWPNSLLDTEISNCSTVVWCIIIKTF